jgi:hypothetical protein
MAALLKIFLALLPLIAVASAAWKRIPGRAVDISAKGNEVWAVNSQKRIYRFNGKAWTRMPGQATRVAASQDGWTWTLNKPNELYRWNPTARAWARIPTCAPKCTLVQINALNRNRLVATGAAHGTWYWNGKTWRTLPRAHKYVAIGEGGEIWAITPTNDIHHWNRAKKDWDLMPGKAVNIDVQDKNKVIVTGVNQRLYMWKNNRWNVLPGIGKRATVGHHHAYVVNKAQYLYQGAFPTYISGPIKPPKPVPEVHYEFTFDDKDDEDQVFITLVDLDGDGDTDMTLVSGDDDVMKVLADAGITVN